MRTRVVACDSKRILKVLAAAFLASAGAACSTDSSRFGENPFTNPFSAASTQNVDRAATTGSIPRRTAPIGAVTSQPLPATLSRNGVSNPLNPVQSASLPAVTNQPMTRVASTTLQQASPIGGSAAGWSAAGGTPVSVGAGDSANALSARYGVPVAAILAANGGSIRPGQQAIIPVYNGSGTAAAAKPGLMEPARAAVPQVAQPMAMQRPAATLPAVAAPVAPKSVAAKPVEAEDDDEDDKKAAPLLLPKAVAPLRATQATPPAAVPLPPSRPVAAAPAQPQRIAPAAVAAAKPIPAVKLQKPVEAEDDEDEAPKKIIAAAPPKALAPLKPVAQAKQPTVLQAAKPVKPVQPAKPDAEDEEEDEAPKKTAEKPAAPKPAPRIIPLTAQKPVEAEAPKVAEAPKASEPVTTQSIPQKPAAEDKPEFRWPAKGRVISGFGSKNGNGDGIAIAVPEGTPVKAAEGGTVAYAGEELKGYGKLVLVRHDNGYVSAYAHNGELNVKRGEKVSRGQLIAKSGSTGNVTSPQLHFELRKGSTPVDPTKFLDN
ncbi:MAG: peptidoglycan DD-metalloendopeptidase family protein [Beijerinckiaceae bacterium]